MHPSGLRLPAAAALVMACLAGSPIVAGQAVTGFTLINADTDADIGPLTDGMTLNLAALPTRHLNVRANTDPATVGSVVFGFDGNAAYRIENNPPYALAGNAGSDYAAWTPGTGSHTLTAAPYTEASGSGNQGPARTVAFTVVDDGGSSSGAVSGTLRKWHRVTITFDGPATSETAVPNPFRDCRLNVTFTRGTRNLVVPGYYAADGNAAETSARSGGAWRVHFAPDEEGTWYYAASFRTGPDVAASLTAGAGDAASFDGAAGSFVIGPTDKTGRDHRGKGLLRYVGEHYLRFAGSGAYFVKGGTDSPENFLACADFDGTRSRGGEWPAFLHSYAPHVGDWQAGDPTWQGGKGKGIIGALNYLAGKGLNSVYFLTQNVNGDGDDVWPWTDYDEPDRYDCSKLDQWEIVFRQMDKLGILLHGVHQEQENDQYLDGGALGIHRKVYYRELIARFGHHLALVWNLGEESTNTDAQRKVFADYIRALDPYGHPIVLHSYPGDKETVYSPLLGYPNLEGPSLQGASNTLISDWLDRSSAAGRKWVVCYDEQGPPTTGLVPDAQDYWHDTYRREHLWPALCAGAAGIEWYCGKGAPETDRNLEDFRSRDNLWNLTRIATDFFRQHLPFARMKHNNSLTSSTSDYCFAKPGEIYAIYRPNGGSTSLDLGSESRHYSVRWYNPRTGGSLLTGNVARISGPGSQSIGAPPGETDQDWVALVQAETPAEKVGIWARFEAALTNTTSYANPYYDVKLGVTYTRPDGSTIEFRGFYDGGSTWRIRFMPDQLGTWRYSAAFNDGAPGKSGAFECVASNLPGMLCQDETNPMWFGYKGGNHVLVRSLHVGDRFFASNWSASKRTAFLDWFQAQGYNMLSVASHYLNRDVAGRGQGWDTPDLWDAASGRPRAAEYRELETLLDELAARRILVYPFAGFFGKDSDYPTAESMQKEYVKYTLARFGAYWNILLNVAGPEPNAGTGWMDSADVVRLGAYIAEHDAFGHPLSVHNKPGDFPYKNDAWVSYVTLQGPKTTSRSTLSAGLLRNHHPSKPLYAQETLWSGNVNHPAYTDTDLRKNAYVIMMAATVLNFGDMDGDSSSGFTGSLELADRNQPRHDIIRRVWDFFETIPFYRMSPRQDLVDNGFCLAEPGRQYLVYLESGGAVNVAVAGGAYAAQWINARNTADRRAAGTTSDGANLRAPDTGDWLLLLTMDSGPQPPAPPSALSATAVTSTRIDLRWADNSDDEERFKIDRRQSGASDWVRIATTGPDVSTHVDTALTPATKYYYKVKAHNAAGNSAYSALADATTDNPPEPAGFVEQGGIVSMEAEHAGTITGWISVAGVSGSARQDNAPRGEGGLTFPVTFTQGGRYYVWLFCRYTGDVSGERNDCFVWLDGEKLYGSDDVTRPDGIRTHSAAMAWSSLPKGPGGDTPDNIRNDPTYALVSGPGLHEFKIGSRSIGFVVDKIVLKLNDAAPPAGTGPPETIGAAPQLPAAPSALTATGAGSSRIALRWTDNSSNETGFKIDRRQSGTTPWVRIAEPAANATTFTDTGLSGSTKYYYRVKAYNAAGDSPYSNIAEDSTIADVTPGTLDVRIAAGADDVEEQADGAMYIDSSDLEMTEDGSKLQLVGLRFTGVNIPAGATITAAHVQFETDETGSLSASLRIGGEASADACPFTDTACDASGRPRTAASVAWTPPAWSIVGEAGAAQRTPDLAAVIQEIVDQPGWQRDNALVLLISGTGKRVARAWDGKPAGAALLHVDYTAMPGDTDADGVGDAWEQALFGSTTSPDSAPDADPDGDGYSNLEEFVAGTGPKSAAEYLGVRIRLANGRELMVSFDTIALGGAGYDGYTGRHYALEQAGTMPEKWRAVPGYEDVLGTGQDITYSVAPAETESRYRVVVWLAP
ncbi:MAG: DUF5060 domain-containing protein [Kiritimatiellae bacterium]|nr:DUF5060 domain-containing protein [Kiritimatiellia bacterium]